MDALWWLTVAVCVLLVPVVLLFFFTVTVFRAVEARAVLPGPLVIVRLLVPLVALAPIIPFVLLRDEVFEHISIPVAVLINEVWLCIIYYAFATVLDAPAVIWKDSSARADGKTVLITGGNSGLGYDAAVLLAKRGATVVLACRSATRGQAAAKKVNDACGRNAASFVPCDLNSMQSVRECARLFLADHNQLHILINNGGFAPKAGARTVEGYESGLGAMHFGHFLLTSLLEETLRSTGTDADPARVIYTASHGHSRGWLHRSLYTGDGEGDLRGEKIDGVATSYMRAKLANVMHAMELAKRWKAAGVRNVVAHSCHPGAVATNIWAGLPAAAAFLLHRIGSRVMRSSPAGALVLVGMSLDPAWGKTSGQYADAFVRFGQPKTALSRDERAWAALWAASEVACGMVPKGNKHVEKVLAKMGAGVPGAAKAAPSTPLLDEPDRK